MAAKGKGRFGRVDESKRQEDFEEQQSELGGNDDPRVKLQDGDNILWVLPPVDEMPDFIERVKVHYGPMHICGRAGKRPDPQNPEKELDDRNFKNCYRCIEAWNAYKDAGPPGTKDQKNQNPHKTNFKDNMSSDQGLIQVVDFTPFFTTKGSEPKLDPGMVDKLQPYVDCLLIEDPTERATAATELVADITDEKRSERLERAAQAGVSVVIVNYDTSNALELAEAEVRRTWSKRFKKAKSKEDKAMKQVAEEGPTLNPDHFLFWIERANGQETFESRGQTRHKKVYNIRFLTPDDLDESWTPVCPVDDLWTAAGTAAIDLRQPSVEGELEDRARGFVRLDDDEMATYLVESDHTFELTEEEEGGTDEGVSGDKDVTDPSSFGPAETATSDAARDKIEAARAKRRAKTEDDEEDAA